MLEDFAKQKAGEFFIKVCLVPFVFVGSVTIVFYDMAMLGEHGLMVYLAVIVPLNVALVFYWRLFVRRVVASMKELALSERLLWVGWKLAYGAGLVIGWTVHET